MESISGMRRRMACTISASPPSASTAFHAAPIDDGSKLRNRTAPCEGPLRVEPVE